MNTPIHFGEQASRLPRDSRPHIGGRRVDCENLPLIASINPFDGSRVAELPACGATEIDAAVMAARAAFEDGRWSALSPSGRAIRLHAFADAIEAEAEALALYDTLEMGIPVSVSMEDVHGSASALRATADLATNLTDEVLPGRPGTLALNVHEPVGVVAAITPWNFPLYIALSKIGAALAAGNSVVLKPSEIASLSSLRLADLAVSAGIPEGVLNVVPGLGPAAGAALAGHHDVDMLTFTGSTVTGKVLMALAGGSNLKRLALECGGKSAHIVLPDVSDLDGIAAEIARGILFNSGQVCTAGSRLIVHRSVREPLMSRVLAHAAAVVAGDPLDSRVDFGPLASAGQYARVRAYLELGCAEDARMVFGKAQLAHPPAGCMLMPVIFSDVSKSMRIAREEIFGPVLCVLDFDTIEQAVEIANATPYGLVGTVWTGDLAAGLGIARRLRCGHVAVAGAPGEPAEVSGGSFEPHGQSGFGAEGGARGLRTMMKLKSLAVDLGAGAVSGRP